MDGSPQKSSMFSSATVIAAIISSVTALLTAIIPGLLAGDKPEPITPTPAAHAPAAQSAPAAEFAAVRSVAAGDKPNLTLGVWTIDASVDDEGTDFSGSTLKFTSQQETPAGLQAAGYFEWRTGQDVFGREHFIATYDAATRCVFLEGQYVDNPTVLAQGTFSAQLSEDGLRLTNGRWGNTPGALAGILGAWEARR